LRDDDAVGTTVLIVDDHEPSGPRRAKLPAREGKHSEAEALAREAVALIEPTDALNYQARTFLDLGDVLGHAHRVTEAREAVEEALNLYSRKENVAGASRAESRLAELTPA
jgi:Flp pilus assembly protein TadD